MQRGLPCLQRRARAAESLLLAFVEYSRPQAVVVFDKAMVIDPQIRRECASAAAVANSSVHTLAGIPEATIRVPARETLPMQRRRARYCRRL